MLLPAGPVWPPGFAVMKHKNMQAQFEVEAGMRVASVGRTLDLANWGWF